MKSFHKIKCTVLLFAAFLCLLLSAVSVFAENGVTLRYVYTVSNVEFKLYKVGDIESDGSFKRGGRLTEYPVDITDTSAAQTFATYAQRDNVTPTAGAVTGEDKVAVFSVPDSGVYLIVGESAVRDNVRYDALPVLVAVNGEDVTINGKFETESLTGGGSSGGLSSSTEEQTPNETTSSGGGGSRGGGSGSSVNRKEVSVLKVWNGSSGESEITAQLLRNGRVYDEVVLNDGNNWRHTWSGLSRSYSWSVVEKSVPDGYSVGIQRDGSVYVITNTADGTNEQTGVPENSDTRDEPLNELIPGYSDNTDNSDNTSVPEVTEGSTNSTDTLNQSAPENELDKSSKISENDSVDSDTLNRDEKSQNENTVTSKTSTGEKLPQTGQLWLPVIVLACVGVLFLIIGIGRRRVDR
jgi:hypothetical protein